MESNHSLLYLWQLRTLFMGEIDSITTMTTAAATYFVGIEKPFTIKESGSTDPVSAQTLLVPAGCKIEAQVDGQVIAMCYLDPYGSDFRKIKKAMQENQGNIFLHSKNQEQQIALLKEIYSKKLSYEESYTKLTTQVFPNLQAVSLLAPEHIDERIQHAIRIIQEQPASNMSNEELACLCSLTAPQLQRWFKRTTGLPVRRYRLWHRLFVTANNMAKGMSMTEAAYDAGFSDSAHFNHTFRSLLGITPSMVFKPKKQLVIYSESSQSPIAGKET